MKWRLITPPAPQVGGLHDELIRGWLDDLTFHKTVEELELLEKEDDLDSLSLPSGSRLAYDGGRNPIVLFENEWSANYFGQTNRNCPLYSLPVQTVKE